MKLVVLLQMILRLLLSLARQSSLSYSSIGNSNFEYPKDLGEVIHLPSFKYHNHFLQFLMYSSLRNTVSAFLAGVYYCVINLLKKLTAYYCNSVMKHYDP